MSNLLVLVKEELHELQQKGVAAGCVLVDVRTEPVVEYRTTLVVRDKNTGKLYKTQFVHPVPEATFQEVKEVQKTEYLPLDN